MPHHPSQLVMGRGARWCVTEVLMLRSSSMFHVLAKCLGRQF